jgi:hypothetical protein
MWRLSYDLCLVAVQPPRLKLVTGIYINTTPGYSSFTTQSPSSALRPKTLEAWCNGDWTPKGMQICLWALDSALCGSGLDGVQDF